MKRRDMKRIIVIGSVVMFFISLYNLTAQENQVRYITEADSLFYNGLGVQG